VDVHVGTLSKAFGSLGGFVACSARMKQYLLTRGRAFVYSTALPTPVVAAAAAALHTSNTQPRHRRALWARMRQLSDALGRPLHSPIAAIVVGDATVALDISRRLLQVAS
jgi:8-amino-7-oxononanoate synthase